MEKDKSFKNPIKYKEIDATKFDGLLLPGGHAKGIKQYLESTILQEKIYPFFESNKPIASICHGVLILARLKDPKTGKSVIYDRKVTCLPRWMEKSAIYLTSWKLGDYYKTYPITTEDEVRKSLKDQNQFIRGPLSNNYKKPHVVVDQNLVTARWPGDVDKFADTFIELLAD